MGINEQSQANKNITVGKLNLFLQIINQNLLLA